MQLGVAINSKLQYSVFADIGTNKASFKVIIKII